MQLSISCTHSKWLITPTRIPISNGTLSSQAESSFVPFNPIKLWCSSVCCVHEKRAPANHALISFSNRFACASAILIPPSTSFPACAPVSGVKRIAHIITPFCCIFIPLAWLAYSRTFGRFGSNGGSVCCWFFCILNTLVVCREPSPLCVFNMRLAYSHPTSRLRAASTRLEFVADGVKSANISGFLAATRPKTGCFVKRRAHPTMDVHRVKWYAGSNSSEWTNERTNRSVPLAFNANNRVLWMRIGVLRASLGISLIILTAQWLVPRRSPIVCRTFRAPKT